MDVHAKLASEFIEHFSMSIPIHSRLYYIPYSMNVSQEKIIVNFMDTLPFTKRFPANILLYYIALSLYVYRGQSYKQFFSHNNSIL